MCPIKVEHVGSLRRGRICPVDSLRRMVREISSSGRRLGLPSRNGLDEWLAIAGRVRIYFGEAGGVPALATTAGDFGVLGTRSSRFIREGFPYAR